MQNIRIQLGSRIRVLRKEMEWSQEKLGEKADLHPTYVGGIERGERNVSLENLEKLASAFNVSLAELFDFPEPNRSKRQAVESKIASLARNQDSRGLEFILNFTEAFDQWAKGKPQE